MAYVRRTDQLINGIKRKIATMRSQAEKMHGFDSVDYGTPVYDEIVTAVEEQAWERHPALYDKMPDAWCYFSDRIAVRFHGSDGRKTKSLTLSTPETAKVKLPCKPSQYYDEINVFYEHQSEALRNWLADDQKREEELQVTTEKFLKIERQIVAFLSTKTSLNAALKEMPELELYVPQEFMDKFHEPTAPRANTSAPQTEAVEVDRDTLAALGVAHRMMSAAE
jgi:hypothetical protein